MRRAQTTVQLHSTGASNEPSHAGSLLSGAVAMSKHASNLMVAHMGADCLCAHQRLTAAQGQSEARQIMGRRLAWTLPSAGDQSAEPTFMASLLSMVAAYSVAADFCTTTCASIRPPHPGVGPGHVRTSLWERPRCSAQPTPQTENSVRGCSKLSSAESRARFA